MKRTCAACGGALFQFLPAVKGINVPLLPTVCHRCGQVCLEGTPLALPEAVERSTATVADAAAQEGQHACSGLVTDPNARVEKYFDRVYRAGFGHGLVRALVWFHQAKRGRLKRLCRLWREAERFEYDSSVEVRMSTAAFVEFSHLIELDVVPR